MVQNKGLIFKSVPSGWPIPGENLVVEDHGFDPEALPPKDGIITKNFYLSFDPYLRGRMRAAESSSYFAPYTLGQPITSSGVARVLKSNNSRFKDGDTVVGLLPMEEYSIVPGEVANRLKKLENQYNLDLKHFIGVLGMPGLTAYSSLYEIGKPKKGETIFISAASGAVGQVVGQLAKREGLIVIGSVGSDEKLDFIQKKLDFDGGFNYKKENPKEALARLAPDGIDIYYENVGGEQLDAALISMKTYGRIVVCGMISQYNIAEESQRYGIKNLSTVVAKRLKMQGFIVSDPDMGPKYAEEHRQTLSKWIHEGKFKVQQSVTTGIENSITGLLGMLRGENFGKAVLVIAEPDEELGSGS